MDKKLPIFTLLSFNVNDFFGWVEIKRRKLLHKLLRQFASLSAEITVWTLFVQAYDDVNICVTWLTAAAAAACELLWCNTPRGAHPWNSMSWRQSKTTV